MTGSPLTERLDYQPVEGLKGVKTASVVANGRTLRVAAVSGLGNADPLVRRILAGEDLGFDMIEVMACPGGCVQGAGHPVPEQAGDLAARELVLDAIDASSAIQGSQNNPDVVRLYEDFFGEPNSPIAHDLLHTIYAPFRPQPAPTT